MKTEVIVIENGGVMQNQIPVFKDLSLQIFEGEIAGLAFDNLMEQRFFLELLEGQRPLSSGRICLEGKEEDYETAARKLSKYTAVIGRKSGLISSISIEDNIFLFSDHQLGHRNGSSILNKHKPVKVSDPHLFEACDY